MSFAHSASLPRPSRSQTRRWSPLAALTGAVLLACSASPIERTLEADEQTIRDNRFMRAIHSPDVEEEPPPEDVEDADEEAGGSGQRHKGEEGKMGRPTARMKSGLYAMKGPKDRHGGGRKDLSFGLGNGGGAVDDQDVWGGLVGTEIGDSYGVGGLGMVGCSNCEPPGHDKYGRPADNPWARVVAEPLSTFSIDVDTASYSNVRRFLREGSLPPPDAVRVEELINYFEYDYTPPADARPFAVHAEVAPCPWNAKNQLVHVGLQGKVLPPQQLGPRNLVFLVDVSGSMGEPDKLPLLRHGLGLLVDDMSAQDTISMVAYAGASGLVLPPTSGADKPAIRAAIARLEQGGSTNGGAGIALAYAQARKQFIKGGINRVILASDGDFNVGVTDHDELVRLIEQQRGSGVFLSVLGFGRGNLNDQTMEQLADKGNGNYAYIDSEREAAKVLVTEAAGTLVTIAKDVKLQVEWNPNRVSSYRLIGYENRRLAAQDFKDDRKDAGELGAGHSVTGIYEVVPADGAAPGGKVGPLKYQRPTGGGELFTVKLRYKQPDSDQSSELELAVAAASARSDAGSDSFRLAAAVAAFGQRLRDPTGKDGLSFAEIHDLAASVQGPDPHGYRKELLQLIRDAQRLATPAAPTIAAQPGEQLG